MCFAYREWVIRLFSTGANAGLEVVPKVGVNDYPQMGARGCPDDRQIAAGQFPKGDVSPDRGAEVRIDPLE
jgi:hypothetical protein